MDIEIAINTTEHGRLGGANFNGGGWDFAIVIIGIALNILMYSLHQTKKVLVSIILYICLVSQKCTLHISRNYYMINGHLGTNYYNIGKGSRNLFFDKNCNINWYPIL